MHKSYQYLNSDSPLIGPIVEKHVGSFSRQYCQFSPVQTVFFLDLGPKIDWLPLRPFGLTFVKNNWWGVWPSCQMMKNCCWPIWAPKSGKNVRPKKKKSKLGFWTVKKFCVKKVTNIQKVTHPYLARLSKNVLEVFHKDIAVCESHETWVFFVLTIFGPFGHFTHTVWPKNVAQPKNTQWDFYLLVHCP